MPCTPFISNMASLDTPYDWNYTVVPQKGLNGRTFPYPRGRLLGGSSSVSECRAWSKSKAKVTSADVMIHQYGSDEDWDRFAKVANDPGWAWKNVKKYIQKVARLECRNNACYTNKGCIYSTRNSYPQLTGIISLASLFHLCTVSTARPLSVFRGTTKQSTHASWRQLGSYPSFPTMRIWAAVSTVCSELGLSKLLSEEGSGAARPLATLLMRTPAQISRCWLMRQS